MSQAASSSSLPLRGVNLLRWTLPVAVVAAGIGVVAAGGVPPSWWDTALGFLGSSELREDATPSVPATAGAHHDHDHAGHDHAAHDHAGHDHAGHDHAGHDDANSIDMSEQARKNIGLRLATVKLSSFTKTTSVPGMVVERPGRSSVHVTAPMSGVVTRIYPIEGEAIEPGRKLFDLRLTHEELVQLQAELLQTAEELDVAAREIKRIEQLAADGALAGRQLIERQYEHRKLEAVLRAKRQALELHGLSAAQVEGILRSRELLKELSVVAPKPPEESRGDSTAVAFQVQCLKIAPGQHVTAGDTLAVLADHAELYVQGEAFERDVAAISRAADSDAPVSATFDVDGGRAETVDDLRVLYLSDAVNSDSRTLDFFVTLPNQLRRDAMKAEGRRFIAWRFRPGQRVQIQIPVETLEKRLVLPIEAVAQDGVEAYVFTPNGDHFDRRPVHVEYRDSRWAVLANDGSLFVGQQVAVSGAQQLQLAMKNKAGGGIDPHAGHHH